MTINNYAPKTMSFLTEHPVYKFIEENYSDIVSPVCQGKNWMKVDLDRPSSYKGLYQDAKTKLNLGSFLIFVVNYKRCLKNIKEIMI